MACQSVLPFINCMGRLMKPVSSAVADKVDMLNSFNKGSGGVCVYVCECVRACAYRYEHHFPLLTLAHTQFG